MTVPRTVFGEMDTMLGRDPISAALIARMYIRPITTQQDLQVLTGYSSGAISQALNDLIARGVVIEHVPAERGPYQYELEAPARVIHRLFSRLTTSVLSHEQEFRAMQDDLNGMPEDVKDNELYKNINRFLDLYWAIIPIYKDLFVIFKAYERK